MSDRCPICDAPKLSELEVCDECFEGCLDMELGDTS